MTRAHITLLRAKIKLSAKSLGWLLRKPTYAIVAALTAFLFFELVFWMFNIGVLWSIMSSPNVSFGGKFALIVSPVDSLKDMSGTSTFALMVTLALLQGITIASLAYALRHQPKTDAALVGSSAAAGLLAVIGLGCPACGTSLVTPIVALFVSGSTVAVSETITAVALPVAITVATYGVYSLGLKLSTLRAYSASPRS